MTFKTRVIVLGSIAAALLAALIFGRLLSPLRMGDVSSETKLLPSFRPAAVSAITLTGPGSTVRLRRGNGWTMDIGGTPYPASAQKIDYLLQELSNLKRGTLVTRSAREASPLGVEGAEAVRITAVSDSGSALCDVSVGKTPSTGRGRYVRVGTGPEIWETAEALSPYATAERVFWEDLRILPRDLASKDVVGVAVKSRLTLPAVKAAGPAYTLLKARNLAGAEAWSVEGASIATADPAKVKNLIESILSMEGADFDATPGAAARVEAASQASVELTASEGKRYTLLIAARAPGDQYPCALAGGGIAYSVPEWRVTQALAAPETLAAAGK